MLRISQADYDLIRWEVERSYPRTCCGILLGSIAEKTRTVSLTLTCDNVQTEDLENRYQIRPEQVVAAFKLARNRGEQIIGFYHSHPDHPPDYSKTDLLEAHWFECSYLIVSVKQGYATAGESFVLRGSEDEKKFELEEMEILHERPLHPPLTRSFSDKL
jgi:proteasome lid subunit RPN8/RPN11